MCGGVGRWCLSCFVRSPFSLEGFGFLNFMLQVSRKGAHFHLLFHALASFKTASRTLVDADYLFVEHFLKIFFFGLCLNFFFW